MHRAGSVYSTKSIFITVVFNASEPQEAGLLLAFRRSFGEKYAWSEDLLLPRHHVLHLLPGGALELLVRNDQEATS